MRKKIAFHLSYSLVKSANFKIHKTLFTKSDLSVIMVNVYNISLGFDENFWNELSENKRHDYMRISFESAKITEKIQISFINKKK